MSETLTVAQAAVYLQMSEPMVRHFLRKGDLPGQRIGRQWRIRRADLERLLAGNAGDKDGDR